MATGSCCTIAPTGRLCTVATGKTEEEAEQGLMLPIQTVDLLELPDLSFQRRRGCYRRSRGRRLRCRKQVLVMVQLMSGCYRQLVCRQRMYCCYRQLLYCCSKLPVYCCPQAQQREEAEVQKRAERLRRLEARHKQQEEATAKALWQQLQAHQVCHLPPYSPAPSPPFSAWCMIKLSWATQLRQVCQDLVAFGW